MNFGLLQRKHTTCIGVDISSTAIKLVELTMVGKHQYRLESYASLPLPKGSVSDGNIQDLTQVAEVIRLAWRKLGSRVRQVVLALPSSAVIAKRVQMQAGLGEEELELQVESEASQYVPFPLEEMNIDFQVLGPVGKSADLVDVFIAAARKEKVDDRVAVAEEAGLKVRVLDVDAFATEQAYLYLARQFTEKNKHTTSMIVDIGAHTMHLDVMVGAQSVFTREQAFGGVVLSQEIQRRFGLSAEEAEKAKRNGTLPANYAEEVLQPFMQTLVDEISRAVSFFTNSTQYNRLDHLLLAGGVAVLEGLAPAVQAKTGIATQAVNPFAGMTIASKVNQNQLAKEAPSLMIACGLALRGVEA